MWIYFTCVDPYFILWIWIYTCGYVFNTCGSYFTCVDPYLPRTGPYFTLWIRTIAHAIRRWTLTPATPGSCSGRSIWALWWRVWCWHRFSLSTPVSPVSFIPPMLRTRPSICHIRYVILTVSNIVKYPTATSVVLTFTYCHRNSQFEVLCWTECFASVGKCSFSDVCVWRHCGAGWLCVLVHVVGLLGFKLKTPQFLGVCPVCIAVGTLAIGVATQLLTASSLYCGRYLGDRCGHTARNCVQSVLRSVPWR